VDINDFEAGMTVRIIVWADRPEHWAEEMDDWQGEIVTISDYSLNSEDVFIEEDEGEWQWAPWDFEPLHTLEKNNPNVLYKNHKQEAFFAEWRTKYPPTTRTSR